MTGQPHIHQRVARLTVLLGLLLLSLAGVARADGGARVLVLTATGVVDGAMAGYLQEGIARAAASGASAVVVQLDTPGGSLAAMDEIKQAFLAAPVPVIVWVAPSGARAASAGTFITLAANLAYMAPATNIGAAAPVGASGEDIPGTMGIKVREDAIASIAALAEARGRPVDWAVSTVRDARSYAASEAVDVGAVDGLAATLDDVLRDADGRTVSVSGAGGVILHLAGATVENGPMNPVLGFLHLLSDPNIAFLLFVLGALGLTTELISPNLLTGVLGTLALILAFVGFGSLPLNLAGLHPPGLRLRAVRARDADRESRPADGRGPRLLRPGRVGAVHRPALAGTARGRRRTAAARAQHGDPRRADGDDHDRGRPDPQDARANGPAWPAGRPRGGRRGPGPAGARRHRPPRR